MSGFAEYAPNMVPTDAEVVRSEAPPAHELSIYSGEELSRQALGIPPQLGAAAAPPPKRKKNVLTGFAEETFVSEHAFRSKHRAVERRGGPEREFQSGADAKAEAAALRKTREAKGDATVAEGDNEYKGPWARYKPRRQEDVARDADVGGEHGLASDEEYEIVEMDDDGDDDVVESGTVVQAPREALARRKEVEAQGDETTTFHGSELLDYQGRTYMHVPQDLDIDLRKEPGSFTNYIPKKLVHTWKHHTKAVTSLNFFPGSGHLLLSGSADTTIKIWDVFRSRELLRTCSGHSKSISDLTFNAGGDRFLSASYDRMMKVWDTETGKCLSRFTTGKTPHVVRFNPTAELGHEFLAGMSDNKIVQFDTRTSGSSPVQEYDHHLGPINTITFVDEGRRFMTTSDDRTLRAWEYGFGVPIKYVAEPYLFAMTRAATHPSGKYVAYQSSDNQIVVYSSNEKFRQNRKKSFRGHNNAGSGIDIDVSPDGQFLASGDTGGYVCFWDWKACKMYHKIQAADTGSVACVRWNPQETSKVATAGSASGDIKYWD